MTAPKQTRGSVHPALDRLRVPPPKGRCNQASGRKLELSSWLLAWDRYAVAAEVVCSSSCVRCVSPTRLVAQVTGQLDFKMAMTHKAKVAEVSPCICNAARKCVDAPVLEVATMAAVQGQRCVLAVLYDELLRAQWEDLSEKLGKSFVLNAQARRSRYGPVGVWLGCLWCTCRLPR